MSTKKNKKPNTDRPVAAIIIYALAVVFLALPIYEWLGNAWAVFAHGGDYPTMLLNLPARLFALVGFTLMFYQFVLGIRTPLFEKVFKRPVNLKRHRWLGKVGFVLILLHGLFLMLYDYLLAGQLLFDTYRIYGMIALSLLIIAVIAAWFFKPLKLSRKVWKGIHLAAYIVFPLGFLHGRNLGTEFATGEWTVNALFNGLFAVFVLLVVYRLYAWVMSLRTTAGAGNSRDKR